MIEDEAVEAFFHSLDNLDPLRAGFPQPVRQVRKRWSSADVKQLPRLTERLQRSFVCQAGSSSMCGELPASLTDSDVRYLCLEAICMIDRFPKRVDTAVRLCLQDPDYSLTSKALWYVYRAMHVDASIMDFVKRILRDPKASLGNRVLSFLVLWRLRRKKGETPGATGEY